MDQFPPVAVAVPNMFEPSMSVMVAPASAVPVMVGVVTFVRLSVFDVPLSLAAARSGSEMVGLVVSTVIDNAVEFALTLPAASVARAVKL